MTNPTTPGIAELLDAYTQEVVAWTLNTTNSRDEARTRILAHVAAIEAQRDFPEELFDSYSVLKELTTYEQARTSAENVTDVLNATVRLIGRRKAAIAQRGGNDA